MLTAFILQLGAWMFIGMWVARHALPVRAYEGSAFLHMTVCIIWPVVVLAWLLLWLATRLMKEPTP